VSFQGEIERCLLTWVRFVVEDEKYNYISARFPADAQLLAEKVVALVKSNMSHT
jgi:hypothetical protein